MGNHEIIKNNRKKINHFVSTTDEDGHSSRVLALFNDQHSVFSGPKTDFLDQTSSAQLFWCQLAESGYNTSSGSDGNELEVFFQNSLSSTDISYIINGDNI